MKYIIKYQMLGDRKVYWVDDEESQGDLDDINIQDEIDSIIIDLLPAYYQYRSHLIKILKDMDTPNETIEKLKISDSALEDKLQFYGIHPVHKDTSEANAEIESKKKRRMLLTQQIIQKRRKNLKEYKQLRKKYEGEELKKYRIHKEPEISRVQIDVESNQQFKSKEDFMRKSNIMFNQKGVESLKKSRIQASIMPKVDFEKEQIPKKNKQLGRSFIQSGKQTIEYSPEEGNIIISNPIENYFDSSKQYKKQSNEHKASQLSQGRLDESLVLKRSGIKPMDRVYVEDYNSQNQSFQIIKEQNSELERSKHVRIALDEDTQSQYNKKLGLLDNFDTFSHKPKTQSNFIISQRQKLEKQKRKAEELKNLVEEVLENRDDTSQLQNEGEGKGQTLEESFLNSIKYLLSEIVNLNSLVECYKLRLKNKQYEILLKLYEIANFKNKDEKVDVRILEKAIISLLAGEEKSKITNIFPILFQKKHELTFDEFGCMFKSKITEQEFKWLNMKKIDEDALTRTIEYVKKMFLLMIEIDYFEKKLKRNIKMNSGFASIFKQRLANEEAIHQIDYDKAEEFLFQTDNNRANRKRVILYFEDRFPHRKTEQIFQWAYSK